MIRDNKTLRVHFNHVYNGRLDHLLPLPNHKSRPALPQLRKIPLGQLIKDLGPLFVSENSLVLWNRDGERRAIGIGRDDGEDETDEVTTGLDNAGHCLAPFGENIRREGTEESMLRYEV